MTYVVGAGPTELHAHIELDNKLQRFQRPGHDLQVRVLEVAHHAGHFAVIAEVRTVPVGE